MENLEKKVMIIESLFCESFAKQFEAHVSSCQECQKKLIEKFELVSDLPFVDMLIKKQLKGLTLREFFEQNIWKGATGDAKNS